MNEGVGLATQSMNEGVGLGYSHTLLPEFDIAARLVVIGHHNLVSHGNRWKGVVVSCVLPEIVASYADICFN